MSYHLLNCIIKCVLQPLCEGGTGRVWQAVRNSGHTAAAAAEAAVGVLGGPHTEKDTQRKIIWLFATCFQNQACVEDIYYICNYYF